MLIDCGANVDARPSHLVQFAKIGSVYMESIMKVKNPRVAIVNIGAEEDKGNALVKETFPLLKNCPDINFIGSIEACRICGCRCMRSICRQRNTKIVRRSWWNVNQKSEGRDDDILAKQDWGAACKAGVERDAEGI